MTIKKVGLIVNPIAGIGGRVGLKGSDGEEIQKKARMLGATPVSPARVKETLKQLLPFKDEIELITYPHEMGEIEAKECGFTPTTVGSVISGKTGSLDTKKAARLMVDLAVDLILFAGGDGTARDICSAIDLKVPVIGIPAGVKIHSAVFAINPRRASELTVKFLRGEVSFREAEVMDIDEDAFRKGKVTAKLYGYLLIPYERNLVQQPKVGIYSIPDEKRSLESLAEYVVENMSDDTYYILGSGTTVKAIADKLQIEKTLLGVDVIFRKKLVMMDLNEEQLLRIIKGKKVKIIVTPIGGQGYIFGRGNQQISPKVISKVGKENIMIIADKGKLLSIGLNQPLLVDTGDDEVDKTLSGYVRIISGYNEEVVKKVTT